MTQPATRTRRRVKATLALALMMTSTRHLQQHQATKTATRMTRARLAKMPKTRAIQTSPLRPMMTLPRQRPKVASFLGHSCRLEWCCGSPEVSTRTWCCIRRSPHLAMMIQSDLLSRTGFPRYYPTALRWTGLGCICNSGWPLLTWTPRQRSMSMCYLALMRNRVLLIGLRGVRESQGRVTHGGDGRGRHH